jgi:hypothetical protein
MYKKAFIQHVRENKVGLLKFDNLGPDCQPPCCNNPAHDHLPGPLYSVEAIHNGVIDFLRELDRACPEVFIILYWGYRSPWWLVDADMYFESGLHIEGASATEHPAPFARDSVTHRLDQAQWLIRDTPWLGKDSLGIWLSDWPWNSCVGKGRWQEGLVMDLFRGNLLAQVWTDTDFLAPPERRQLAEFLALLRACPDCFDRSHFLMGDPSKPGLYGYCASDGHRALLAMHNAQLCDVVAKLDLTGGGRLLGAGPFDVYRLHPHPARLVGEKKSWGREAPMAFRPHEVVLLEVVPEGQASAFPRKLAEAPMPASFLEPTRRLDLVRETPTPSPTRETAWRLLRPASAKAGKATLTVLEDGSVLASGENVAGDVYTIDGAAELPGVTAVLLETLTDKSLPEGGPGRAENGNFALTDFHLRTTSQEKATPTEARIERARADFSQTTHGGWSIDAALDNDPKSGWSIHPRTGRPHAAVFELAKPLTLPGGGRLKLELAQGERGHSLGRLRLCVTADASPELPAAYRQQPTLLRARVPAARSKGLLVLTAGKDAPTPRATLGQHVLTLLPVWSERAYWQASWNAWRVELPPCGEPRGLSISYDGPGPGEKGLEAFWIPLD